MKTAISFKNVKSDVLSGIIVALVSIPISMGYAQIAGLPPVYGLYGSLLPILLFGLITSSPQFVVGVDAMPAVMVGNALAGMGYVLGSPEATALVPVISLLTGLWFLVFRLLRAGRVIKYISTPVMGGFLSGVGVTIILMQLPKLFGGDPGTGELPRLLLHLVRQLQNFHPLSAGLGILTVILILLGKKKFPRLPMPVFLMAAGVILTAVFHIDRYGVRILPQVDPGLPKLRIPALTALSGHGADLIVLSLTIALVVMAQTLLASNNYAMKYSYRLDAQRELLAYAAMELAGCAVGCCPVNGSVSRSGIADQFQCRSQLMSLTAALVMALVLLFGTGLLKLLPVPILTGIVIAALIGIVEGSLAKRLWKSSRREFTIFLTAFAGVLFFGTINGVMIGVVLSFFAVVVRAVVPPRSFLGQIPGSTDFYDLARNRSARALEHTVIYRFGGNLFFANIDTFQADLEAAVRPDTRQVIVDAGGIGSIDMSAADRIVSLERKFRDRGIRLYLTGHVGDLNDQFRQLGAGCLIENGTLRKTISLALRDRSMEPPYALEGDEGGSGRKMRDESESFAEFEWLYGNDADAHFDALAKEIAKMIIAAPALSLEEAEAQSSWGIVGLFDEDTLLDYIEMNLEEMAQAGTLESAMLDELEVHLEQMRPELDVPLSRLSARTRERIKRHREELRARMAEKHAEQYARVVRHREKLAERIHPHDR